MSEVGIDVGLLSPVTVGHDDAVTDAAVLGALVTAEAALIRAYSAIGREVPSGLAAAVEGASIDVSALAAASVAGGNPVIPLAGLLKEQVPAGDRVWVHRGATSQDIIDSALMLIARRASAQILASLAETEAALAQFAAAHQGEVAAARTLTQHAVPTTVGLRAANWLRGVRRASERLDAAARALPAQLGGAGGTLAAFVEVVGVEQATALPAAFAQELGLAVPDAPWHTTRWPVTELGDALVQSVDALGVIAGDVATLSRTEIGEIAAGSGGSSAMPQKRNPAAAVLIRSAALRAPQLGATLHLASALAVDERPDGAWHAEWPTVRELLRVALGASAHAATLAGELRVDSAAVARNLAVTRGLIVAERLSTVLGPLLGRERVAEIVRAAGEGEDLATLIDEALLEAGTTSVDVRSLLDPAQYTGLARDLVERTLASVSPALTPKDENLTPTSPTLTPTSPALTPKNETP